MWLPHPACKQQNQAVSAAQPMLLKLKVYTRELAQGGEKHIVSGPVALAYDKDGTAVVTM
jgi:hypothetical protein